MKKLEDPEAYFLHLIDVAKQDLREEYERKYETLKMEILALPELAVNKNVLETFQKIAENSLQDLKGDKGDTPSEEVLLPLIASLIPELENGENYILTEDDKKEIAGMIEAPVVEKVIEKHTKTIVEKQPIVTEKTKIVNQIKEKAVADKPEVIAKKLNKLKGKVDLSVIDGLEALLKNLQRAIKEKHGGGIGGGMGKWVHKTTSISSATTTVTLDSKVAANGLANIARYQGQVLDYGVHYTINNKTVTLLFTPEDNTTFSIAYVRT